ncbi:integrin alpha-D-like [Suricata suricatta]|uniref:integrin alpha-D-like n=1 Tax=Suricata suricatta TaxID=37032 RepID=UPI00115571C3|nr:integrin alpha-D-like [Suricata suricatta]
MAGAHVRMAPGQFLTNKPSLSRQEESTKYFNFSTSQEKSKKEAEHRYRVNNLSQRDLAISINFWVPILLDGVPVWDVAKVASSQNLSCVSEREPPQHPDFLTQNPESLVLNCSIADCMRFRCDLPSFGIQEELDFILKGNLSFGWASQTLQKKVLIVSEAEIMFDRSMYSQLPGQEAFLRAQVVTVWQAVARLLRGLLMQTLWCCVGGSQAQREEERRSLSRRVVPKPMSVSVCHPLE